MGLGLLIAVILAWLPTLAHTVQVVPGLIPLPLILAWLPTLTHTVQVVPGLPMDCYAEDRDINLAFMVKVTSKGSKGVLCTGRLYSPDRVKYVEAFIYSIRQINQRQDLLPNVTLGFVIMDTCGRDLACLARATFLIPDPADDVGGGGLGVAGDGSCKAEPQRYDVVGVAGPASSREAVLLSSLMSIFHIPVVADFSTSDELSDKSRFEYYLRLVPPDRFQAAAMLDLLNYFDWTYAFLLYSEGSYGENAGKLTLKGAQDKGICFGIAEMVPSELTLEGMGEVFKSLVDNGKARALILFLEPFHLDMVIQTIDMLGLRGYFIIIGGDTMSDTDYGAAADGAMVIHFTGRRVPDFEKHYLSLTPKNNPNNPWMADLWQSLYDCSWNANATSGQKPCQDYENTPYMDQEVGEKVSTDMDAPLVFALGIQALIQDSCPAAFTNKATLRECVTGKALLPYLRRVSFDGYSTNIKFDPQGDMIGSYSIRQYMASAPKVFVEVAVWRQETNAISVDEAVINWAVYTKKPTRRPPETAAIPESLCSYPCAAKEYYSRKDLPCCWDCKVCRSNEILTDNFTACASCPELFWPDEDTLTMCLPIAPTYLLWADSVSLGLLLMACLGVSLTLMTSLIYMIQRNNRLIKASSRELSSIILVGILLAYVTIVFYVAKPNNLMCVINRFGFGLTVTFIYAPLLVKTNRIYRIFTAGRKGTKKPALVDSRSQLTICVLLLLIQVVIAVTTGSIAPPTAQLRMPVATEQYVELYCHQALTGFLPPLAFNLFLIFLCAIYGFLTRKLPENFNESWYIFVSVSTTTFLLMVFLPAYFTAFYSSQQVVLLACCLFIVPSVTLLCLYFPKMYAIYFVDETMLVLATVAGGTTVAPATTTTTSSSR